MNHLYLFVQPDGRASLAACRAEDIHSPSLPPGTVVYDLGLALPNVPPGRTLPAGEVAMGLIEPNLEIVAAAGRVPGSAGD